MGWMFDNVGRLIGWLQEPAEGYEPFTPNDSTALRDPLRPDNVLLVEGNNHISGVIKYLTQSTWSHSALYVGPMAGVTAPEGEPHVLIEANSDEGVVSAPLSKYQHYHTRICRRVGPIEADCEKVCRYASERIGLGCDLKNIIDLMRYLFPWPVTQRRCRRMITLSSGDAAMSYDLRVRSQTHYLLARSVVEFLNRHQVPPVSPNACAERRRAVFGGYPVQPSTFLCRWHEIRLTLHQAKLILLAGVGGFWGVQRRR